MFTRLIPTLAVLGWIVLVAAGTQGQEAALAPAMPPPRAVPGITTPDQFPQGCVDCHIHYTDMDLDARLSTEMAAWSSEPDSPVVAAARSVARPGAEISGVHPAIPTAFGDVPRTCLGCHDNADFNPVPLVPLLHKLHLRAGEDSVFLSVFQGECTHCHKLDPATGVWRVPSGPEN